MTQNDKELILKDLCARLPYGVKVQHQRQDYLNEVQTVEHISRKYGEIETESVLGFVDDFKPYLRPMSSMTEEERKVYIEISSHLCGEIAAKTMIDWLNANHFDYRGLIPMNLAIEAPEGMYKK